MTSALCDFSLQPGRGGGRSGPSPPSFRLCTVYVPVQAAMRGKLWRRLEDFMAEIGRPLIVAGDFNNQFRVMGRARNPAVAAAAAQPPPLTVEERGLNESLAARGLREFSSSPH